MKFVTWVLQVLLAFHTIAGAVWKFTTPQTAVPSLLALPHAVWIGLGIVELPIAICLLVAAFYEPLARFAPFAALAIAAEMLLYIGVAVASGTATTGEIAYWLVVAALCGLVAYCRVRCHPRQS